MTDAHPNKYVTMTDPLYRYLLAVSVRETDALRRLRVETARLPEAEMQISPDQGQFLFFLTTLIGARRVLEVGTFTGYSALWVAEALPDDGRLVACDVREDWTTVARSYWAQAGVASKIDLRLAPAIETLDDLLAAGEAGSFDFAFIDADKPRYDIYYERALSLVRSGGLIALDNVLWNGQVADPAVTDADTAAIRALNAKLVADTRVLVSMLPVADGLTLAYKRP